MASSVSCVIPARWASSRFPGKLLQPLAGTPLIIHTLRRAEAANCFAEILCLTDSENILAVVRKAGFRAELSGPAANGSDRISKNLRTISHDLIVNLQGDEPVFPQEGLVLICRNLQADPSATHVLVHDRELSLEEIANPNRCKILINNQGQVLDFYRAQPHGMNGQNQPTVQSRLQMGVYGYAKHYLRQYAIRPISPLELSESHELLRDLTLGPIRAHTCAQLSQAVDVPEDLEEARVLLLRRA
jgi:3-deoxy-manno-octulosonate cytidylyltransferase (CMP-KDO synthetase)